MMINEVVFLWMDLKEADPEQNEEVRKILLDGGVKCKFYQGLSTDQMHVYFDEKISLEELQKFLKGMSRSFVKGINFSGGVYIYLSKR